MLEGSRGFNKSSRSVVPVLSKCSFASDCDDADLGCTEILHTDDGQECDCDTILEGFARVALCDGLQTARATPIALPAHTLPSTRTYGQEVLAAEADSDAAQPAATAASSEEEGREEETFAMVLQEWLSATARSRRLT